MPSTATILLLASIAMEAGAAKPGTLEDPIGLDVRDNIRVVYQVKTGEIKKGIAAGLFYIKKLTAAYEETGVEPAHRRLEDRGRPARRGDRRRSLSTDYRPATEGFR